MTLNMPPSTPLVSMTSLRGIAAWWVVFFHFKVALPLSVDHPLMVVISKGFLAVDFFFILSGFVIFINYQDLFRTFNFHNFAIFANRRIARIYPLHITILGLYLLNPIAIKLFSSAKSLGEKYDLAYFIASIFLVQNWGFFDSLDWNVPAWSVSTEVAAYILFPICVLAIRKLTGRLFGHFIAVGVTVSAIILLFTGLGFASIGDEIAKVGVYRCLFEFFLGTLAGSLYLNHYSIVTRYRYYFLLAAMLAILCAVQFDLNDFFFVPACFWLLIIFVAGSDSSGLSWLKASPLVFLGEISYSTYLVHFLLKDWVKFFSASIGLKQFLIYTMLVYPASVFLYLTIEKPGRSWLSSRLAISLPAKP